MKKIITFLAVALMFSTVSLAQTQKSAGWPELKNFHALMSASFHAAEEGNFSPLKEKAPEMYKASKIWYASEIPAEYKPTETKANLEKLMIQCHDIWSAIDAGSSNDKLKQMITEAHDTFHKIVGECKK